MKFRLLVGVLACGLAAAAQTAAPADEGHERKLAEIRKLMSLTGGDKMANQMLDQIGESVRASGGPNAEQYFAGFRKEFDLKKVFDLQVAAYDKYLSAEDVQALVAFYESPAGRRAIEAMPKITSDMMTQAMQMSQEIAQKLLKKMQDEPPK